MVEASELPTCLYKYRGFSHHLLDMLIGDELYYSGPDQFNDPLDCRPVLDPNLPNNELERVLTDLHVKRRIDERRSAAKSLKSRGSTDGDRIVQQSQKDADGLINDIRYLASDPSCEFADPLQSLLQQHIEEELLRRYDRGIVSFGVSPTCPLLWSHYGQEHYGICVGYSVPLAAETDLKKVCYSGDRRVLASDVAVMEKDCVARMRVDEAVLLRKAQDWKYEREWRLIGRRGAQESPLELEEVIFGIRCKPTIRFTIIKVLENRERPVKFFEVREVPGEFELKKCPLDTDELRRSLSRRSLSRSESVQNLDRE